MNNSHPTSSSDCAARPISGFPKKSSRLTPQQADEAKKRSERTDKTGRSKKCRPHSRFYGWLLSSPEWLAASCADRAALMVLMAHENGNNNGRVRMGARRLAGWRNGDDRPSTIDPDTKGRSAAAERLRSLAKAGLIVRTNQPSKGPTEARREAEWLISFIRDERKDAQPTPFTARWKSVATKKPPFYMLTKEVAATPAWKALSDAAQVLFVTLGVEVMKRSKYDRTPPLAISVRRMAELMGVGEDTAHRAIRDLEAKGFVMRHVAGRGLAGQRVTATFSLDTEACRPEPGVVYGPRRRFASWQPGENLSSTPLRRQPRAKPEPEVGAEPEVEAAPTIAEPAAEPAPIIVPPIAEPVMDDEPDMAEHRASPLRYAAPVPFMGSGPPPKAATAIVAAN
ncbi:MAG: hypothetical protein O9296_01830 [Novosphingobium sp.]|nr:hypothetical protein [Novosphingobium sp.]